MKRKVLLSLLSSILLCYGAVVIVDGLSVRKQSYIELGAPASKKIWIYLCGMLAQVVPGDQLPEWQTIDRIGKELGITFLAMVPNKRSSELYNMLYWPSDNREETLHTYRKVITAIGGRDVAGYIGFSNGGFFLNRLAQYEALEKPIITIGAAGPLREKMSPPNKICLMISKDDIWHYDHAIGFYNAAKDSNLSITLRVYEGGHIVPYDELKDMLQAFSDVHG